VNNKGGIGLSGAVFIVFLVLKLTGNIDWSWWWVTSPLWIGVAFLVVFSGAIGLMYIGHDAADKHKPTRWDEVDEPFVKPSTEDGPKAGERRD
jgi:fatty acid desaturase